MNDYVERGDSCNLETCSVFQSMACMTGDGVKVKKALRLNVEVQLIQSLKIGGETLYTPPIYLHHILYSYPGRS